MLGLVTGLEAEVRIARRLGMAEAGGGLPAGAEAAAERLVARGATALVSFGLAGGLDPALAPGTLVIPAQVLEGGQAYAADPALAARFGGLMPLRALSTDAVLATPEAKREARAATGAAIVDLESGAVARVAARHALPFLVLRAVCDPAHRALPPLALTALDANGRIAPARVLASLLRTPGQIPALLALARDAARARATLARLE
jgi:adenosylhomocysteine nucleosidase